MASLQRITDGGRDCYRLRFYIDRRRKTLGLGSMDEPAATEAKAHVEHLIDLVGRGRPPVTATLRWLDGLPGSIHDRLAAMELCEPRKRCELPRSVLAFMRAYIASRTDWKKPENYRQAVNHLAKYLGRDAPIGALTKGDAERWHRWLMDRKVGPGLSPNTAGQQVKRCRQMMRAAINDGIVDANPFDGVKIDLSSDRTKNRFIGTADALAILDQCPDQEWRVIFALCRWGGLRCPSEVLGVRWSDILWDRDRFKVRSPKTERYGKGERVVPLFPELRAELDRLYSLRGPGVAVPADGHLVTRYRSTEANLRTTFLKIIDRAGIPRFPKPFIALRASRRTELERSGGFANHVLNAWFGHTAAVAEAHYLSVTEDDFVAAANGDPLVVPSVVPFVDPSGIPPETSETRETRGNAGNHGLVMAGEGPEAGRKYTPEDSNL